MTKANYTFGIFLLLFILAGCIQTPTYFLPEPEPTPVPAPDPDDPDNPDPDDPDPDDPDPDDPDPDDPDPELPAKITVSGTIEMGAFLKGSTVIIEELDDIYHPTGQAYSTPVINDQGHFLFENIVLESPYVRLSVEGFYFDQVNNKNSSGQITLKAIEDLRLNKTIYINPISHLKAGRILELLARGSSSLAAADMQAQGELLSQFGLDRYNGSHLSTTSLTDGTDEAAILVVISSTFIKATEDAFGLAKLLADLEKEFNMGGSFSEEQWTLCWKNSMLVRWDEVEQNLKDFYRRYNKNVSFKDFSNYIDWDGDGIAGNEDKSQRRSLFFETNALSVDKRGERYSIAVTARTNYEMHIKTAIGKKDLGIKPIGISSYLNKDMGRLELEITPATSWWVYPAEIVIVSTESEVSDTLRITQEGLAADQAGDRSWGVEYMLSFVNRCQALELAYTHPDEVGYAYEVIEFKNRTLTPDNEYILAAFQDAERAVYEFSQRRNDIMDHYPSMLVQQYTYYTLESLTYFIQGIWAQGLVVDDWNWSRNMPQYTPLGSGDIWDLYKIPLEKARDILPVKSDDPILPAYRDVATVTLARYYMRNNIWGTALNLLEEIINSGRYKLNVDWRDAYREDSKEAILSYPVSGSSGMGYIVNGPVEVVPVLTYGEVMLCAAESAYRQNDMTKALRYVNQMLKARGKPEVNSGDFINTLANVWGDELKGTASYLLFLKRYGMAERILHLSSTETLLPIPRWYVQNYNMKQSPGW